MLQKLPIITLENYSEYRIIKVGCCTTLKQRDYRLVDDISVGGEAPKSILRVYEYGTGRRANPNTWPIYITKTGHKWYPSESITEQLLSGLGNCFYLRMAETRLCEINTQFRLLSKYFLKKEQQLVHGAEIYSGFLSDKNFVDDVEKKQMARDFFTVQFTYDALKATFPEEFQNIFKEFVKMLLFDALIGNNDRHYFNWGVITHLRQNRKPYFSPIYDTARGLLWNLSETKLLSLFSNKQLDTYLIKYLNGSKPKIGVDGIKDLNHFMLAEFLIKHEFGIKNDEVKMHFNNKTLDNALNWIDNNFQGLYSPFRLQLIKRVLKERFIQIFDK